MGELPLPVHTPIPQDPRYVPRHWPHTGCPTKEACLATYRYRMSALLAQLTSREGSRASRLTQLRHAMLVTGCPEDTTILHRWVGVAERGGCEEHTGAEGQAILTSWLV